MKRKLWFTLLVLMTVIAVNAQDFRSIYDIKVVDINGKTFDMSTLKGKKVLIVNTASQCGFTPQYSDLEKLYNDYKDKNFVVIAVPSNNFGDKEPGTNAEIKNFVETNYGVTFPVMAKSDVTGENENPLYKWLTSKDLNGVMDSKVAWNFQKYMIDENGQIVGVVQSNESPASDQVREWLDE